MRDLKISISTNQNKLAVERETGIEPASLAWKARVLPLNYSRQSNDKTVQGITSRSIPVATHINSLAGGGGWIRTSVGVSQQIYSLPPLATRAPLRRISNYSTSFLQSRKIPEICTTTPSAGHTAANITGAAGGDRTHDPWLRRPILYPLSYSRWTEPVQP